MVINVRSSAAALAVGGLLLASACSDTEEIGGSSFCDEVQANADAFSADPGVDVPAGLIGALRSVVDDGSAPDEIRDAYEQLTTASDQGEIDAALSEIDQVVAQCGVDLEG